MHIRFRVFIRFPVIYSTVFHDHGSWIFFFNFYGLLNIFGQMLYPIRMYSRYLGSRPDYLGRYGKGRKRCCMKDCLFSLHVHHQRGRIFLRFRQSHLTCCSMEIHHMRRQVYMYVFLLSRRRYYYWQVEIRQEEGRFLDRCYTSERYLLTNHHNRAPR